MNYIIFNLDGSIKITNFTEIIVQGDNLTDKIFAGFENPDGVSGTAEANFTLPNGDITSLVGVASSLNIDQSVFQGFLFTLTSNETALAGQVYMSLRITNANATKFTYETILTINKSGYVPTETTITMSQYENLLSALSSLQEKYVINNARFYPSLSAVSEDLDNLALNQLFIVCPPTQNANPYIYFKSAENQYTAIRQFGVSVTDFDISNYELSGDGESYVCTWECDLSDGTTKSGTFNVPIASISPTGYWLIGGVPTGVSAISGFGTPTATATSLPAGSQPTVSVSSSGSNREKVFSFTFGIPKGDKGDKGDRGNNGYGVTLIGGGITSASGLVNAIVNAGYDPKSDIVKVFARKYTQDYQPDNDRRETFDTYWKYDEIINSQSSAVISRTLSVYVFDGTSFTAYSYSTHGELYAYVYSD